MIENEEYFQAQYWDEIVGSWQDIPDGEARTRPLTLAKAIKFREQGMLKGVAYIVSVVYHSRRVYFTDNQ